MVSDRNLQELEQQFSQQVLQQRSQQVLQQRLLEKAAPLIGSPLDAVASPL